MPYPAEYTLAGGLSMLRLIAKPAGKRIIDRLEPLGSDLYCVLMNRFLQEPISTLRIQYSSRHGSDDIRLEGVLLMGHSERRRCSGLQLQKLQPHEPVKLYAIFWGF